MKKNIYRVLSGAAVVLCLWVIFGFSAQPAETSLSSSGGVIKVIARLFNSEFDTLSAEAQAEIVGMWQNFVRKTAHFCEYALLGFLSANALCTYRLSRPLKWVIPIGFCVVAAAFDEFHQTFVEGRGGRASDLLLDSLGVVFGVVCFALLFWIIKKIKEKGANTKNDTKVNA